VVPIGRKGKTKGRDISQTESKESWAELLPLDPDRSRISLTRLHTQIGRCPGKHGISIPCKHISARHLIISRCSSDDEEMVEPHARLHDTSTYGTYLKRGNQSVKVSKGKTIDIYNGDIIIFYKALRGESISYTFSTTAKPRTGGSHPAPALRNPYVATPPSHEDIIYCPPSKKQHSSKGMKRKRKQRCMKKKSEKESIGKQHLKILLSGYESA